MPPASSSGTCSVSRRSESGSYATIAGQEDRPYIIEHPLALFRSQLGVVFHRVFDFGVGKILLFAESFGIDGRGGNALLDQESLGAVDTPFGESLIVWHGAARVGVAFQSQAGIGLGLE